MGRGILSPAWKILHPLADPVADMRILNVHILDTHRAAIDGLELIQNPAEFQRCPIEEGSGTDGLINIRFGETKFLQLQHRLDGDFFTEWIQPGEGMTKGSVGVDQGLDTAFKRDGTRGSPVSEFSVGRHGDFDSILLVAGKTKLETLEKRGPIRSDGSSVFAPLFVIFINGRRIPAGREGCAHEDGWKSAVSFARNERFKQNFHI